MLLKSKIKKMLQYYPRFNETKIIKNIDKYQYVSFDVFDTLIKRDVENPQNVFKIISKKIHNNCFYEDRINAEKIARKNTNQEEITGEDIYNVLENKYHYQKKELRKIYDLEISLEEELATKNIEMERIYRYCLDNNKKIIITSNMYLSKNNILELTTKDNSESIIF